MSKRSKWKVPFQNKLILQIIHLKLNLNNIKLKTRSSCVSANFIDKRIFIHIGNKYKKIYLTKYHIGYKFGEFTKTRISKKTKLNKLKNK